MREKKRIARRLLDEIQLNLPMPVRRIVAYEKVVGDKNPVALHRGPIVYCIEGGFMNINGLL